MSEWISVDSGLPNCEMLHVLVYCEGGNIEKAFYIQDRVQASSFHPIHNEGTRYSRKFSNKESCHFSLAHIYGYKITHWMPLPSPPEAK